MAPFVFPHKSAPIRSISSICVQKKKNSIQKQKGGNQNPAPFSFISSNQSLTNSVLHLVLFLTLENEWSDSYNGMVGSQNDNGTIINI